MKKIYEYELSGTDRDVSSSFMKKNYDEAFYEKVIRK